MIRLNRIWKFYIISTALLVVVVMVSGFALQVQLKKKLRAQLEEQVFTLAKVLSRTLPDTMDPSILTPWCREYKDAAEVRITLMEKGGRVICDSGEETIVGENRLDRPEISGAIAEGTATAVRYSKTLSVDLFYAALLIKEKDRIIRLALPMTEVKTIENEVMIFFALALYVAPILAIAISFLFARYVAPEDHHITRE